MSWHFLQGQAVASWEGNSLDGAPSALLKLMNSVEKSSSKDKETDYLTSFQSGTMYKPLMENIGEEKLTLLLEDFLAKILAQSEKEKELKEKNQASGKKWLVLLARYNQDMHGWKTVRSSQTEGLTSLLETLPKWGMTRNGELWALTMPKLPTGEKEFGSWPTASARDWKDTAGMATKAKNPDGSTRRRLDMLARKVYWVESNQGTIKIDSSNLLNPDWVEWLMGWPIGWTNLENNNVQAFNWNKDPAEKYNVKRIGKNIKDRKKRLMAIGNGQVPATVVVAWKILKFIKNNIKKGVTNEYKLQILA